MIRINGVNAIETRLQTMMFGNWDHEEVPNAVLIVTTKLKFFFQFMFSNKISSWVEVSTAQETLETLIRDLQYAVRRKFGRSIHIFLCTSRTKNIEESTQVTKIKLKKYNVDSKVHMEQEQKECNISDKINESNSTKYMNGQNRCMVCNKKLKISNIRVCKCQSAFCSEHILSHECSFDYKQHQRDFIRKQLMK